MALGKPNMKILIVDDFPTMRRILRTILKQLGYETISEAEDGKVAYEILEGNPDIELIICDWNMPQMNGLGLLKLVRANPRMKHLPFLMVAAETDRENIIEAVKSGVNNYIVKPFTSQVLSEKLHKIFEMEKAKAG